MKQIFTIYDIIAELEKNSANIEKVKKLKTSYPHDKEKIDTIVLALLDKKYPKEAIVSLICLYPQTKSQIDCAFYRNAKNITEEDYEFILSLFK